MATRNDFKLWSLLLKPGPPVAIVPSHAIRISNAALSFDLQDPHGRSTLMLTHDADDGRADTVLCSLFGGRMEQCTLNIILGEGKTFAFALRGKNDIYLTGNAIENSSLSGQLSHVDGHRGGVSGRQVKRLKRPAPDPDTPPVPHKDLDLATKAAEEPYHSLANVAEGEKPLPVAKDKLVMDKGKGNALAANVKDGVVGVGEVLVRDMGKAISPSPTVLIKDGAVGTGTRVTSGCTVQVNYLMRLRNRVVVQDYQNKAFSFVVGRGEVIKGWDDNIVGVRVGTHRQLVIPPELAYQDKGCGLVGPGEVIVVDFIVVGVSGNTEEQTMGKRPYIEG